MPDDSLTQPFKTLLASVFDEATFAAEAGQPAGPTADGYATFDSELGGQVAEALGTVTRRAKLFEVGDYAAQAFRFTEDDLKNAAATFTGPCPIDHHHSLTRGPASVFDGKLGQVVRVYPGPDGRSLFGDVEIPRWLDAVLEQGSRKVSAAWDRLTKRLHSVSLTVDPQIPDAAIFAAFSAAQQEETTAGDVPASDNPRPHNRSTRMNPLDWMKKKAQEEGVELDDIEATFGAKVPPEVQAAIEAERAENARLKAQVEAHTAAFAKAEAGRRQADAATFAREAVTAGRVLPASLDALAALTAHIAASDSVATFAEGEKSGTALLAEFVESLPDLKTMLTTEQVPSGAAALFNATTTPGANGKEEITDEKIAELASLTPLGRAGLQDTKKA